MIYLKSVAASRHLGIPALVCAAAAAFFAVSSGNAATNTAAVFATSGTDLSIGTNYTPNITPTSAPTSDVEFTGSYTSTTLTVNGAALNFGSLDDLDTTQTLTITNSNAAAGSIILSTASNSLSGTPGDLIYVKSGGTLTLQNGSAGGWGLTLGVTGNVDEAGTLNIGVPLTIGAGTTTTFSGGGTANITGGITATTGAITVKAGTVNLSGNNSYTGLTTVSGGTLVITGTQAATDALTISGGTLDLKSPGALGGGTLNLDGGTTENLTSGPLVLTANPNITIANNIAIGANSAQNGNINFGTGTVGIGGSYTIALAGTGATYTFGGPVSNTTTSGITTTVNGVGNTLVIDGTYTIGGNSNNSASTFAGTGNVEILGNVAPYPGDTQSLTYSGMGTLTMAGSNSYAGYTYLTGTGTIALDFSQSAYTSNISGTGSEVTNDGTILVKGASGAANSQTFNGMVLEGANNDYVTVNQNGATAVNVSLGDLHRIALSTLGITLPTSGTISTTAPVDTLTNVVPFAAANGGTTWATINSVGNFGAFSNYSTGDANYLAGNDMDVANGDTPASGVSVDSLRFNSAGETLNLSGANTVAAGILVTPSANTTTTVTGGTLVPSNPGNELTFLNYGNTLDIASGIADSGNGPTNVTLGGTGTTILAGGNTYTGLTTLTGGVLSLNGGNLSLPSFAGGESATVALGSGTLTISNGSNNSVFSGQFTGTTASEVVKSGTGALVLGNPVTITETYAGTIQDANGWLELSNQIGANGDVIVLGGSSSTPTTLFALGSNGSNFRVVGGGSGALTFIGTSFIDSGVSSTMTFVNDPTLTWSTFGYDWLGRTVVTGQFSFKGGLTGAGNLLINSGPGSALQSYSGAINNAGTITIMSPSSTGAGVNIGNNGVNGGFGANVTGVMQAADGGGLTDYMPDNDTGFAGPISIVAGVFSDDASGSGVTAGSGVLNSGVSLTMAGGTFQLKGNASNFKTQDQVISGLTLNAGNSTIDADNLSGDTSTTIDLRGAGGTATITRNVGGTLNFIASTGAFGSTSVIEAHNSNDAGGILGGWATVSGTTWAQNNGSDVVAGLPTASYTTLSAATGTSNVDYGSTTAQSASAMAVNTLRFNNSGAAILTLSGSNVLNDGGLLVTTNVGSNATNITGGALEGGAGTDLVVDQFDASGGLFISSTVVDNTSPTALTKSGPGALYLTSTSNTYSGATYLNSGILNVATLAAQGTNSSLGTGANGYLVLNGGDLQYTGTAGANLSQGFTLTNAGGTFDSSGAGSLTVSGPMTITGAAMTIGGTPTNMGGAQVLTLTGTSISNGGLFTSAITDGTQGNYTELVKAGAGTWTLSSANSYTGYTYINGGTLVAANVQALGNLNATNVVNPALVIMNTGTLQVATDTTVDPYNLEETGNSTLVLNRATSGPAFTTVLGSFNGGSTFTVNAGSNISSGVPAVSFTNVSMTANIALVANSAEIILGGANGTAVAGGADTFNLENNTASSSGSSVITGSISDGPFGGVVNLNRNTGNGSWVLQGADSYTGSTLVNNGALILENNSALGTGLGSSTSSVSVSSGAVLQLLGGISTTTAVPLSLNGTGISGATNGALESVSGNNTYSGLLYIAGSNISVGSDTPGNTLTLSNTGTILCSSVGGNLSLTGTGNIVVDSVIGTNTGGLTKSGPGMATLMNASTYSGTTSITAGILNIENNSSLGSGVGTSTSGVGVQSGAALQLQGNITTTTAVRLTLNGAGVNTNGALENVSGNNTYTGPITMAAGAWIGSDAGNLVLSNTSNITTTGNNSLTFTGAGNISVAGGLSINGGSVTKNGSGALTLSGSSNYTGTTTVNAGAVIVTGSLSGSYAAIVTNATLEVDGSFNNNAVEVAVTNGALQGNGVTGGPVVLTSGTLSPGLNTTLGTPATGTLTANNNVSLDSNSVFAIRLGLAASGTDSDELIMGGGGVLSLSGSLELTLGGNIDNAPLNSIYDIINGNGNSITGTFNGIAEDGVISVNGDSFEVLYNSDAAGDGGAGDYVALDLIAVPEPGTWAILASGLGMLVCMQRVQRRSRKAKA